MKKLRFVLMIILMVSIFIGCGQKQQVLKGAYQSDLSKVGYAILLSFSQEDNSFVEYINNRKVDSGTFEEVESNTYRLLSEKQDFEIVLNEDDVFDISLKKINGGEPVQMIKVGDIPIEFADEFNDVEEYQELLD